MVALPEHTRSRPCKPWPPRQPQYARKPFTDHFEKVDADCLLRWNIQLEELHNFFHQPQTTLSVSFDGVSLPPVTQEALANISLNGTLEGIDRIIIYVDGSSQPSQRHLPPLQVDMQGIPDAWAFIVLGEKYDEQGDSALSLIGWSAHQVRYDQDSPFFAGATRIGPHIAEREGLFFAALWRAQLNTNIPTVFRSDSSLAIGQASGRVGAIEIDLSFSLLRGLFQFLEAALGPDLMLLEHIYGHNSDPLE